MCTIFCIILTAIIIVIMEGLSTAFVYLGFVIVYPALLILAGGIVTIILNYKDEQY